MSWSGLDNKRNRKSVNTILLIVYGLFGSPPTGVGYSQSRIALDNADGDNSKSDLRGGLCLLNVSGFGYAILKAGTVELQ